MEETASDFFPKMSSSFSPLLSSNPYWIFYTQHIQSVKSLCSSICLVEHTVQALECPVMSSIHSL